MSHHKATAKWKRHATDFNYKTYDRTHEVTFGGGQQIQVTAAPEYLGKAEIPNPEEMLVAALSSCHMLTFLALAAYQGIVVDSYLDEAVGTLEKDANGKMAVTKVILNPHIEFGGENIPDASTISRLHEKAHDTCFIANSVTTEIIISGH